MAEPDSCCRRQLHGFLGRAGPLGARAPAGRSPASITAARSGLPRSACATVFLFWRCTLLSKYGAVAVISPLVAGYPLATLLLELREAAFTRRSRSASVRGLAHAGLSRSSSTLVVLARVERPPRSKARK